MTIHKEGKNLLLALFFILVAINVSLFWFKPGWLIVNTTILTASIIFFLLILQFFRHPKRSLTKGDKLVIAPADGKVVVIEDTVENEYLKDKRKQVSIFMSPVNVHVNRTPVGGAIQFFKYHAGKYLVAWHPKSSTENERTTMVIKMKDGIEIVVRQIAGALAKRIKWYVKEGEQINQGDEFGFIKFGSRVDLFLPTESKIKVNIGQKTKGGCTVIAELP